MTALKYVSRVGSTVSEILQDLALQIQEIINKHRLQIQFHHIPRVQIIQTNHLSRLKPTHNRYLRNSIQLPEKTVLEPQTRPRSRINRCVSPTMAKTQTILISSLEADSESVTLVPDTEHKGSSSSDPTLEDTILVPDGSAIHPGVPDTVQDEPQVAASRLEIIQQKLASLGALMQRSKLQGGSSGYLRNFSAAITSVFQALHPDKPSISTDPMVKNFFKAKKRSEIRIPRPQQLNT
ncbi:hypothetical protein DFQ28_007146 [Apophysomyces sp. BC1034]|nr:hypothetical protein DFQ30_007017 [Apophysomyces sp. BC1015]KAG0176550.1 hypothetical protein DFQ29_005983 [Apophysomyces sp. BC1021]KAG0186917.1 hypothetical protein DFQ28_007146 [Apophysomyces sp. BC1034]